MPDPTLAIMKLPNISASLPQLEACVKELRIKGFDVPLYPHHPANDEERDVQQRYSKVLGSAVNPVLRQGNSDRHASAVVKKDAQKNPSPLMKLWSKASRTHVAHMTRGDFYSSEQSVVMSGDTSVAIELVHKDEGGTEVVETLKGHLDLVQGEVLDGSFMNVQELCQYYERCVSNEFCADACSCASLLYVHFLFSHGFTAVV